MLSYYILISCTYYRPRHKCDIITKNQGLNNELKNVFNIKFNDSSTYVLKSDHEHIIVNDSEIIEIKYKLVIPREQPILVPQRPELQLTDITNTTNTMTNTTTITTTATNQTKGHD